MMMMDPNPQTRALPEQILLLFKKEMKEYLKEELVVVPGPDSANLPKID